MKKGLIGVLFILALLLILAVTACTPQPNGQTSSPSMVAASGSQATYADPFSYCSAVGTIDAPDSHYTGIPVPDAIIQGYLKAAGLENNGEPAELLQKTTFWRCMNKSVYVCNIGANLPCDSKADTNKAPTQPMQDFCKANPDADSIPMSVTGHATIYSWGCVKDAPKLLNQIDQVDAAGYSTSIWYKLPPNP
jgi:hypothetical protein